MHSTNLQNLARFARYSSFWVYCAACVGLALGGCATPPPTPTEPPPKTPSATLKGIGSNAQSARDYRRDAAAHLYDKNKDRIYRGKMPPLLYAIGVVETEIDAHGYVSGVRWLRAPTHAPEVIQEIEQMVKHAEPYPAPVRLGRVIYTDTWLWHKSGKLQLDTLSEGQL